MGKKLVKGGWVYDYDISAEYRRKYDCELTDVRYVLGEQFDTDKRNVLICIGINPSMAMPNFLDPTLRRVQDYAKRSGEYGAWYMLNVYPQRATNPNNMDTDNTYSMEIHLRNLTAIEELLSTIERQMCGALGVRLLMMQNGRTCLICYSETKIRTYKV